MWLVQGWSPSVVTCGHELVVGGHRKQLRILLLPPLGRFRAERLDPALARHLRFD